MVARYSDAEIAAGATALSDIGVRVEMALSAAITVLAILPLLHKLASVFLELRDYVREQQAAVTAQAWAGVRTSAVEHMVSGLRAPSIIGGGRLQSTQGRLAAAASATLAPPPPLFRLLLAHSTAVTCGWYLLSYLPLLTYFLIVAVMGAEGNVNRVGGLSLLAGVVATGIVWVRSRSVRLLVALFQSLERILISQQAAFATTAGRQQLKRMQRMSYAIYYLHLLTIVVMGVMLALIGWEWSPSASGMSREELSERLLIGHGVALICCIVTSSGLAHLVFRSVLRALEQHAGVANTTHAAAAGKQRLASQADPMSVRAVSPTPGGAGAGAEASRWSAYRPPPIITVAPAPGTTSPKVEADLEAGAHLASPTSPHTRAFSPTPPPSLPLPPPQRAAAISASATAVLSPTAPAPVAAASMYSDVQMRLRALQRSSCSPFITLALISVCISVPAIRERFTYVLPILFLPNICASSMYVRLLPVNASLALRPAAEQ